MGDFVECTYCNEQADRALTCTKCRESICPKCNTGTDEKPMCAGCRRRGGMNAKDRAEWDRVVERYWR